MPPPRRPTLPFALVPAATVIAAALLVALPTIATAQSPTRTPFPFDPYRRAGAEILLPILNFEGQDDVCDSWIDVQNLGVDAAKIALVTWGEPGFCPPQSAGALRSYCSPIVRPGGAWTFSGAFVPSGSRSGALFRLSADPFPPPPGTAKEDWDNTPMADIVCRQAFWYLGLADEGERRLVNAYRKGLKFDGIDMRAVAGTGTLAATVHRTCPGAKTPSGDATARYNGIPLNRVGDIDPLMGGYVVVAPDVHVGAGAEGRPSGTDGVMGSDGATILYIQNADITCASIDVWFAARDGCGRAKLCVMATVAPFETFQVAAADCGAPGADGAIWVRSTQPIAVVADRYVADAMSTYAGTPTLLRAAFDPAKAAPEPVGQAVSAAYVANADADGGGITARITVANVSPTAFARIRLTLRDPSGNVRAVRIDWLCPRGSSAFDLGAMRDVPRGWYGSARVDVLEEGAEPDDPGAVVSGAALSGVVRLIGDGDGGSAEGQYGMTTLSRGATHPNRRDTASDDAQYLAADTEGQGFGLIALPTLHRGPTGSSSTIVIHNAVAMPGSTWILTALFDANGLTDVQCDRLAAGAQARIDLGALAVLGSQFRGAAIVSAVYWEHDTFDPSGLWTGTWVDLEAVAVDDEAYGLGDADDGNEVRPMVSAGVPLRRRDVGPAGETWAWPTAPVCDSPAWDGAIR